MPARDDVTGLQRAVAALVTDDEARAAWAEDPTSFAARHVTASAATALSGIDPSGLEAMTLSHVAKRERFDYLHRLHHELEARKAVVGGNAAAQLPVERPDQRDQGVGRRHTSGHTHHDGHSHGGWHERPNVRRDRREIRQAKVNDKIRVGCTYRAGLIPWLWLHNHSIDLFEHSLDGLVGAGTDGLQAAGTCSEMKEFTLHAIGLSLGSEGITERSQFLDEIEAVLEVMGATEFSDHLAFSRVGDIRMHDFAPVWRVEEQLDLFADNVSWLQDRLGVQVSVENVATLFNLGGEMGEAEFSNELVRRTGCGLLLDISNVLINQANGFCDAGTEFEELDLGAVTQVHLAGGELLDGRMWDAHSHPVPSTDIEWLERLLPRLTGCRSIIIERDERLTEGQELIDDVVKVREVVERATAGVVPALQ